MLDSYTKTDGTQSQTRYYYVLNLQGDVVALMTAFGSVWATYTYDAWGKPLQVLNGSNTVLSSTSTYFANVNPLRYRGYYYDTELGFYYLQSRYYDPSVGRFVNADGQFDANLTGGLNLFAYCGNNPVNRADPSGECYYNAQGQWCHDNWEYLCGYIRQQEPATYLGNTQSGSNVYLSDTTNYSTTPNSIKVVVNYNKTNPELQTCGFRSSRALQSEINNLIIARHSLSTYHWKGGPTYYDANLCYQKALFCDRERGVFADGMSGVDYSVSVGFNWSSGYAGFGLVILAYSYASQKYLTGYESGRGVFQHVFGLAIISALVVNSKCI